MTWLQNIDLSQLRITWLGGAVVLVLILAGILGYRRGFIKEVVSTFFVILAMVVVWFVNPYVNTFLEENTKLDEKVESITEGFIDKMMGGLSVVNGNSQEGILEDLPLPEIVKKNLIQNNTIESYKEMAVYSFKDYVVRSLTEMIMKGTSFLISYILATILIQTLSFALDILAKLPVIKGVNRMAGACLGMLKALLFIWIALLVVAIFCNTEWGMKGIALIRRDAVLGFLYEWDILVKIFMNVF